MTRKYIIVADDSIQGFDEEIAKLEREWGAEEIEPCEEENPNCTECRYYDKEKHHCPRFCKVIETTMAEITSEQTRWIPCSARLPEEYIHVLCQFTLGGMGECYLAHGVFHVVGGLVMTCNEVIAWMPLPQSYEAESEDKE